MSVAIGIVHDEKVDAAWVWDLLALRRHPLVSECIHVPGGPGNFDVARNKVAAAFLQGGADHLLTVDTDMAFAVADMEALLADGLPVVSAVYFIADEPPRACFSRRDPTGYLKRVAWAWRQDPFEVDACGGGFMLIRRDVLTDIGREDADRAGPWYRQSAVGASGSVLEPDHAFCQRVQQAGHGVYVDPLVRVGHIKARVLR